MDAWACVCPLIEPNDCRDDQQGVRCAFEMHGPREHANLRISTQHGDDDGGDSNDNSDSDGGDDNDGDGDGSGVEGCVYDLVWHLL